MLIFVNNMAKHANQALWGGAIIRFIDPKESFFFFLLILRSFFFYLILMPGNVKWITFNTVN